MPESWTINRRCNNRFVFTLDSGQKEWTFGSKYFKESLDLFLLDFIITALRYIYAHCGALHFLHWDLETKKSQRHLSSTKRERFFFSRPKVPRTAAVNKSIKPIIFKKFIFRESKLKIKIASEKTSFFLPILLVL